MNSGRLPPAAPCGNRRSRAAGRARRGAHDTAPARTARQRSPRNARRRQAPVPPCSRSDERSCPWSARRRRRRRPPSSRHSPWCGSPPAPRRAAGFSNSCWGCAFDMIGRYRLVGMVSSQARLMSLNFVRGGTAPVALEVLASTMRWRTRPGFGISVPQAKANFVPRLYFWRIKQ